MNNLNQEIKLLFTKLFPICRSITGKGVRDSLSILNEYTSINIQEIKSGEKCYDWEVPQEWNIRDAFIADDQGKKIISFKENNLHVVSYSTPINKTLCYEELVKKIYYIKHIPDAIPYRTSYYKKDWGFCVSYNQFKKINKNKNYTVCIDSDFSNGVMNYADYTINGASKKTIIFSTYCCHPSMSNDNLSGLILWINLLNELKKTKPKYTYKFICVPETIGAIGYLSKNEKEMKNVIGGFILTCVAGKGIYGYKKSFLGDHWVDKLSIETLSNLKDGYKVYDFDINGSDERQYSSPYFRIPIGTITKDKYYEYDGYHNSLDGRSFFNFKNLTLSLKIHLELFTKIEASNLNKLSNDIGINDIKLKEDKKKYLKSNNPKCEPMLGKRNLYDSLGGQFKNKAEPGKKENTEKKRYNKEAILWVLFYSDSKNTLEDIVKKCNIPLKFLNTAKDILVRHNLIRIVEK
jgi:aminopeptidase-like protein